MMYFIINSWLALATCFVLAGCSRDLHFRVIEASSGQPLSGVAVVRHSRHSDLLFGTRVEAVPAGTTGPGGEIEVSGIPENWMNTISFEKEGYERANALYPAADGNSVLILSPVQPKGGEKYIVPAKGDVEVRLHQFGKGEGVKR